MNGATRIAMERQRQIEVEGYTGERDAEIGPNAAEELAVAGACYAQDEATRRYEFDSAPCDWPWNTALWKPTPGDRVRELEKAGALIAAAIDAMLREQGREV